MDMPFPHFFFIIIFFNIIRLVSFDHATMLFLEFWTKLGYYKYRLKTKIMSKLVRLSHVYMHISHAAIIDYGIEVFLS